MINIDKYPRTLRLPFSPGNPNRKLVSSAPFIGRKIIITEKMDGSNTGIVDCEVYARSRGGKATHPSFNIVKNWAGKTFGCEGDYSNLWFYFENMYAIHSIEYTSLPHFLFLLSVVENNVFLSWDVISNYATMLNVPTPPVLYEGFVKDENQLKGLILEQMKYPSMFGGPKEGVVVRSYSAFPFSEFQLNIGKFVRENHVQTDIHWSKKWKPTNIAKKEKKVVIDTTGSI